MALYEKADEATEDHFFRLVPGAGPVPVEIASRDVCAMVARGGQWLPPAGAPTLEALAKIGATYTAASHVGATCLPIDAPVYEHYLADLLAQRKGTPDEGTLPPTDLTMRTEVQVLELSGRAR